MNSSKQEHGRGSKMGKAKVIMAVLIYGWPMFELVKLVVENLHRLP